MPQSPSQPQYVLYLWAFGVITVKLAGEEGLKLSRQSRQWSCQSSEAVKAVDRIYWTHLFLLVFRLPQLEIETTKVEDCTVHYSTGTFTCLAAVFKMKRSPGYLVFSTYIPSVLIVVMSWISFWIPPESTPARVTLGVTSLLTLATLNTQTQQSLPPVSYTKVDGVKVSTS